MWNPFINLDVAKWKEHWILAEFYLSQASSYHIQLKSPKIQYLILLSDLSLGTDFPSASQFKWELLYVIMLCYNFTSTT